MQVNVRRLTGASLWLMATGLVLLLEVQMSCQRTRSVTLAASTPPRSLQKGDPIIRRTVCSGDGIRLGGVGQQHTSAILVVGSTGSALDGEFEVTLKVERTETHHASSDNSRSISGARVLAPSDFDTRQVRVSNEKCLTPQSRVKADRIISPSSPQLDVSRRVFFIHSPCGSLDDPASYSAIDCRLVGEAASIRVYAEQSVLDGDRLDELIAELTHLADETIGPAIHDLVGPVRDVDGDGKLAVVLTARLGQRDTALADVDGLTRASDFVRQNLRPFGNESDVIFLNANLQPSERLRAVLAHEWTHAAIFGRRYGESGRNAKQPPAEDDWLNEALAHLIEIQASGSSSNVAHRVQHFLERPEAAPLLVRDYYRPEFWRHHGCRGAAFLFLDWCIKQSGPQLLDRLIDGDEIGVENLERATGRSFDDLFREWTTSIGTNLTRNDEMVDLVTNGTDPDGTALCQRTLAVRPAFHEWRPKRLESQSIMLRLRGTTAAFVRVTLDETATNWRLFADAPPECGLQLTVIPIASAAGRPQNAQAAACERD